MLSPEIAVMLSKHGMMFILALYLILIPAIWIMLDEEKRQNKNLTRRFKN